MQGQLHDAGVALSQVRARLMQLESRIESASSVSVLRLASQTAASSGSVDGKVVAYPYDINGVYVVGNRIALLSVVTAVRRPLNPDTFASVSSMVLCVWSREMTAIGKAVTEGCDGG